MSVIRKETIDHLLTLKGANQEDLAQAAGINPKTFSARKKTGKFDQLEIDKMAAFLGVSPMEMIGGGEKTGVSDLYRFLAEKTAQQDGMMRVLLSAVGELLAEKRGIPIEEMYRRLTEAAKVESLKNLEKLQ